VEGGEGGGEGFGGLLGGFGFALGREGVALGGAFGLEDGELVGAVGVPLLHEGVVDALFAGGRGGVLGDGGEGAVVGVEDDLFD
jgi:hypothetical protein